MATRRGRFVLLALAVLLVASLWRTVAVEREKRNIAAAYAQARQVLSHLEVEHTQLTAELTTSQNTLQQKTTENTTLQTELKGLQEKLEQTASEVSILQREHEQLRESNASLTNQLSSITTEKQQLEAKLSDLKELHLAIRAVKRKMSEERWAAWRAHIQAEREADQLALAAGNRGFVIRKGASTLGTGSKMRVQVLEPQAR